MREFVFRTREREFSKPLGQSMERRSRPDLRSDFNEEVLRRQQDRDFQRALAESALRGEFPDSSAPGFRLRG